MKPNGLCLLERQELKFAIPYKKIPIFTKQVLGCKNFRMELFGGCKSVELRNVVFDVVGAKDLDVYFRRNYSRARVRSYHTKNYSSHFWGEYRQKRIDCVVKSRRILKSTKELVKFLDEVRGKGLVFNNFSCYERQSFNNKKNLTRITIDRNIVYLNNDFEPITHRIFKDKSTAIVKFKFAKKPVLEECRLLDFVKELAK